MSGRERRGSPVLAEALEKDRARFVRYVRAKLGGAAAEEAEDVVSDLVLRLVERADLPEQVETMTAYLYRALGNAIIDLFRRRRSRPAAERDFESADAGVLVDPAPNPEAQVLTREALARIGWALERLSPGERAVWIAVEVEGWTFRALSEAWGQPIGTLLARKSRATTALRRLLSDERSRG
ncbi:sigma-24 (FecI) [Rhodospirillum rubrum F11]|uniref:Sigma-24 (FecI) n=2 Tax=Rhodospirillum rubrum TaxID=1085 RepID=Q2RTD6_RHORT|nr:sigma-70 family RNA polymerase sigma factor [Rhodospirillum rubrum]ABC22609.1 Sigma-24 (FecI) [Rhodospirillum rubrum ATCC 11170]AEO48327.1 sigma-24 (FecI) [Rhodospirillum rubrum F11]MBK5954197.1 RNA polymerase subunit sigma-24 [Rhodospirillum rubrum]QXG82233.1 sigma-70 family RNA polymerase sigma factor [Rhodospirillum rubrum]